MLIALLIALPVLISTATASRLATEAPRPDLLRTRAMGEATCTVSWETGQAADDLSPAESRQVQAGIATDSDQSKSPRTHQIVYSTTAATISDSSTLQLSDLPLSDPRTEGMLRRLTGKAPDKTGEVAISPSIAKLLHVGIGARLELTSPKRSLVIVGTVEDPAAFKRPLAVVAPGQVLQFGLQSFAEVHMIFGSSGVCTMVEQSLRKVSDISIQRHSFTGASGATVSNLSVDGTAPPPVRITNRIDIEPPLRSGQRLLTVGLPIGVSILSVLITAAAFTTSARRRTREVALLVLSGGKPADGGAVIVFESLVLGAAGAVLGVAIGIAVAAAIGPLREAQTGVRFGPLLIQTRLMVVPVVAGLLTSLLACAVPAWSISRSNSMAAVSTTVKEPSSGFIAVPGAGLLLVGVLTVYGAASALPNNGDKVYVGFVIAAIGASLLIPLVLSVGAARGKTLPLGPRMALRHMYRYSSRVVPGIAVTLFIVSLCTSVSCLQLSNTARVAAEFDPNLRPDEAQLVRNSSDEQTQNAPYDQTLINQLSRDLHVDSVGPLRVLGDRSALVFVSAKSRPVVNSSSAIVSPSVAIADEAGLDALGGDEEAWRHAQLGEAVVFRGSLVDADGFTHVLVQGLSGQNRDVKLRAFIVERNGPYGLAGAAISRAAAQHLHLPSTSAGVLFHRQGSFTQLDAATAARDITAAAKPGDPPAPSFQREIPAIDENPEELLGAVALALGLLAASVGVVITTLTKTESLPELSLMQLTGATKLQVRANLAVQGLATGLMGCWGGLALGYLAMALVSARRSGVFPLETPRAALLVFALVVPLLSALTALTGRLIVPERGLGRRRRPRAHLKAR